MAIKSIIATKSLTSGELHFKYWIDTENHTPSLTSSYMFSCLENQNVRNWATNVEMLIFSDLRALTSLPDTSTIMSILMPRFIRFLLIPFQMSSTNWGSLNTLCTTILLSHNKPIYNVFLKSVQIKWPFYSYLLKVFIKKESICIFMQTLRWKQVNLGLPAISQTVQWQLS